MEHSPIGNRIFIEVADLDEPLIEAAYRLTGRMVECSFGNFKVKALVARQCRLIDAGLIVEFDPDLFRLLSVVGRRMLGGQGWSDLELLKVVIGVLEPVPPDCPN